MHRSAVVITLFAIACLIPGSAPAADEPVPEWAEAIKLAVLGGPLAGKVTITVNGEWAADLDDDTAVTDIGDLLKAGENTMEIRVEPAGEERRTGEARLLVAPWFELSRTQREAGEPLAVVVLPDSVPAEGCTQSVRFWAGPPAEPSPEITERYWLVANGPPANVWVTVSVNGRPLMSTNEGRGFIEITEHVQPGRNEVEYTTAPTCVVRPTAREDDLAFFVTTGEKNQDVVEMTAPMAYFSVSPQGKPKERTKTASFRGR